jgi:DNA-binding MarR family transcriptional regulator
MASPSRPLPTVIGPTENALRALLLLTLSTTPIRDYVEWAALNLVDQDRSTGEEVVDAVRIPLKVDRRTAHRLLDDLADRGLLAREASTWVLTPTGATVLQNTRARVAAATTRVVDGLPPADVEVAVRVLDHVRSRAEDELDVMQQTP